MYLNGYKEYFCDTTFFIAVRSLMAALQRTRITNISSATRV